MAAGQTVDRSLVQVSTERLRVPLWLLAAGWLTRTVARVVWRHPLVTGVLVVLVAGLRAWGWLPVALALLGLVAALVGWRFLAPRSFARWPGRWLAVWWVRCWRYRGWVQLAQRHGLTARGGRAEAVEVPRLARVRLVPGGERVLLGLPHGLCPGDVAARTDSLAHALGALSCRVVAHRPGSVWLHVTRTDTLAAVLDPLPVPDATTPDRVTELLRGVPTGRCEDGSVWRLRLAGTHVLLSGASNSGKGSVFQSVMSGLAAAIHAGLVEVVGVDPKGGMELRPAAAMFCRLVTSTPAEMADCLEDQVQWMNTRAAHLAATGSRQHVPTLGSPHRLVMVDELMTLTALADRQTVQRIERALGELLSKGRACGLTVLASVVEPSKDVVRWRGLFPTRVGLRLVEDVQVDMALGDGARRRGAVCDTIPETAFGVGYVLEDGRQTPVRVRATYPTDAHIAWLAATYTAPRGPVLHALTGGAA